MAESKLAVVVPAYNEQSRIPGALISLELQDVPLDVVVVDNNSTDDTAGVTLDIGNWCKNTKVHLVSETSQGVGAAADTGFRYAMEELAADHIARIDADTEALPGWAERIEHRLGGKKRTALVTGPAMAGGDGGSTFFEAMILPRIKNATRIMRAIRYADPGFLFFAPGHNMATTAEAYRITGGFPRTDFYEQSDDIAYTRLISQYYGISCMAYDRRMVVMTSQRRLRSMGMWATARFYTTSNALKKKAIARDYHSV